MSGPVDLVFEGGGVKGIGLAGAYAARWRRRAGSRSASRAPRRAPCFPGPDRGPATPSTSCAKRLGMHFREFKDEAWQRGSDVKSRAIR